MADEQDNNESNQQEANGDHRSMPAKCVACHRAMNTPVVCDYCHTLNPISGPTDYFQLLSLPRRFDLDPEELRRKYLALNRYAHPDFYTSGDSEVRELSLSVSASINNAYRTLSDPISRAGYLVEVLGGKSSAENKAVPEGFLGEVMMLREEIEQAKAQGDQPTLARIKADLQERMGLMIGRLKELFAGFDTTVACEAVRLDELSRIRVELNAISYIRRILSQMPATARTQS